MAKKLDSLLRITSWLSGTIVSLMVGVAMINKYIIIPHIPVLPVIIAGWVVLVTTALNVILVVLKK